MIPLRLDDIGSASKQWEVYSHTRLANVGPLKYFSPFKAWGPYRELNAWELETLFATIDAMDSQITVAITAAWVERNNILIPYYLKYPEQAKVIRTWMLRQTVEVANHGLTHCVVGHHRPRWFSGNRQWHREFVPGDVDEETMIRHVASAQKILERFFGKRPTTFVPPGYVFPNHLHTLVKPLGIDYIATASDGCHVWHDRDFVIGTRHATYRSHLATWGPFTTVRKWARARTLSLPSS